MKRSSIVNRQSSIIKSINPLDELDLSGAKAPAPGSSGVDLLFDGTAEAAPAGASVADGSPPLDLPLSGGAANSWPAAPFKSARRGGAAPLPARAAAFAADAALVMLLTAAPVLGATAGPGHALAPRGLWWTAAFALYLFFFATVVPLLLFGKTVGMALTGLTARGGPGRTPLTAAESARRWIGTALTLAGLGIPLLFTRRDGEAPSPADRLSRRPLALEEV